jgi:2-amino-4-hydroxy-6-hydroxymethyldihydropteridine diphosphokinase
LIREFRELARIKEATLSVQSLQKVAYVALGSNLGDARKNVLQAIERLQNFSERPLHKSSLWKTTPVDSPPESADFVNAVVALVPRADETAESLLKKLQALENEFGRAPKKVLNEPRPLDLDLIAFGNEQRNAPDLILPHPRSHQRRFVLQPLAEIAPDLILRGEMRKAERWGPLSLTPRFSEVVERAKVHSTVLTVSRLAHIRICASCDGLVHLWT